MAPPTSPATPASPTPPLAAVQQAGWSRRGHRARSNSRVNGARSLGLPDFFGLDQWRQAAQRSWGPIGDPRHTQLPAAATAAAIGVTERVAKAAAGATKTAAAAAATAATATAAAAHSQTQRISERYIVTIRNA